jgi:elongator complex protein 2
MVKISLDYISTGGNRHPAAADWDPNPSGAVAFGADNNIALWNPLVGTCGSFLVFFLSLC